MQVRALDGHDRFVCVPRASRTNKSCLLGSAKRKPAERVAGSFAQAAPHQRQFQIVPNKVDGLDSTRPPPPLDPSEWSPFITLFVIITVITGAFGFQRTARAEGGTHLAATLEHENRSRWAQRKRAQNN